MNPLRRHLSRNLVAYVALLLALSPTAYAGTKALLPRNSVGSRQVIDHSLRKVDFSTGALPARQPPRVRSSFDTVQAGRSASVTIGCTGKRHATGGGAALTIGADNLILRASAPAIILDGDPLFAENGVAPTAWTVSVDNTGATDARFGSFVVCTR